MDGFVFHTLFICTQGECPRGFQGSVVEWNSWVGIGPCRDGELIAKESDTASTASTQSGSNTCTSVRITIVLVYGVPYLSKSVHCAVMSVRNPVA